MMKSYSFSNSDIAKILSDIAAAYEVKNESKFKILAYQRAAVSVEHATSELKDLWDDEKLDQVPGIGEAIAKHLDELFRTGKVHHFEAVLKGLPASMFVFLDIPGVGPKTAYSLAKNLKITGKKDAINKLKKAASEAKIRQFENFGEKSEADILAGISSLEKGELKVKRMLLPYADSLASEIISYLKQFSKVIEANPLGSLRRMVSTIGDIDISVCTKAPKEVMDYFVKYKRVKTVLERGKEALLRVVLFSGQQVDLRFSRLEGYGAMLQYFTGSKQHNIQLREFALKKGLSLSEYGIKQVQNSELKAFKNEASFYEELGLDWIPPELREGKGEIEAALKHKLPKLVQPQDIRGDLHVHSNFPIEPSHDLGQSSAEEMVEKAEELGYEYIGFSEHNPSFSKHSSVEILDILKKKQDYFEQLNYSQERKNNKRVNKLPIRILNGLEVDIKPDGRLAIPEEAFSLVDYVIASIHSNFDLSREKMTDRIIKGLSHPKANIFGHPTGRLLEEREGYEVDWDKLFDFCKSKGKVLEISAWPNRLDLPDALVQEAIRAGVMIIINSDSHSTDQLVNMKYGVSVARRGWAENKNVVNSLPYSELSGILFK